MTFGVAVTPALGLRRRKPVLHELCVAPPGGPQPAFGDTLSEVKSVQHGCGNLGP